MSEETSSEVVGVVPPEGRAGSPRRVRRWGATDILKYYESKASAAEAKGWRANLFIDGVLSTPDELAASPPGVDVMVCLGVEGSSAVVTQFFELAPQAASDSGTQVVAMAGEVRQLLAPLVSLVERLTTQHMKVIENSTHMAKVIRRSLKNEVKAHKRQRAAEKATADAIAEQDSGVSAIIKTLGRELGPEGLQKVIQGGAQDLFKLVNSRLAPSTPPTPSAPPTPKAKKRGGRK